jgi:glycosyltransferase involved in cell wall biosynthesis
MMEVKIILERLLKVCRNIRKIKAFTKENGGLSDARNFGIDRATGDYIGFVDSDDYVTETMFEEMLLLLKNIDAKW